MDIIRSLCCLDDSIKRGWWGKRKRLNAAFVSIFCRVISGCYIEREAGDCIMYNSNNCQLLDSAESLKFKGGAFINCLFVFPFRIAFSHDYNTGTVG